MRSHSVSLEAPLMPPLALVRRQKLLSQRDLAAEAGVTPSTIYLIENGRSVPRLRTMRAICDALQVEPSEVDEFRSALEEQEGR